MTVWRYGTSALDSVNLIKANGGVWSVSDGRLAIPGSYFTQAGTYFITVTAEGYDEAVTGLRVREVKRSVSVSAGANATVAGEASQAGLVGAMQAVTVTPEQGYKLAAPTIEPADAGVTVSGDAYNGWTVSGTPGADVAVTFGDAELLGSVTVSTALGSNMSASNGAGLSQTVAEPGALASFKVTPEQGYKLATPTIEPADAGVTAAGDAYKGWTVSGTPSANIAVTFADAEPLAIFKVTTMLGEGMSVSDESRLSQELEEPDLTFASFKVVPDALCAVEAPTVEPADAGIVVAGDRYQGWMVSGTPTESVRIAFADAKRYSEGDVVISDEAGLRELAQAVSAGATFDGCTVELASDIDASGSQWVPIGVYSANSPYVVRPFKGTFDGKGHTVTYRYAYSGTESSLGSEKSIGLFGCLQGAVVRDLKVAGSVDVSDPVTDWAGEPSNAPYSGLNVGGVAAWANGVKLESVSSSASVASPGKRVGGLVGSGDYLGLDLVGCSNYGDVSARTRSLHVGGLVGDMWKGSIKGCSNSGAVSVADVEQNFVADSHGANAGGVDVSDQAHACVGGLVGYAQGARGIALSSCSNRGRVSGYALHLGGLVGQADDGGGSTMSVSVFDCRNAGAVSSEAPGHFWNGVTAKSNLVTAAGLVGVTSKSGLGLSNCYSSTAPTSVEMASGTKFYAATLGDLYVGESGDKTAVADCYGATEAASLSADALLAALNGEREGDEAPWKEDLNTVNGGLPILEWEDAGQADEALYELAFSASDASGSALAGFTVELRDAAGDLIAGSGPSFGGLAAGRYSYTVSRDGYVAESGSAAVTRLSAEDGAVTVAVKLDKAARVTFSGIPAGAAVRVAPAVGGEAVVVPASGELALREGAAYSWEAPDQEVRGERYLARKGAFTASDGLAVDAALEAYSLYEGVVWGDATDGHDASESYVSKPGAYRVGPGSTGKVYVSSEAAGRVTLVGNGAEFDASGAMQSEPFENLYVVAEGGGVKLALRDTWISNADDVPAPAVGFTGADNELRVEGAVVIDQTNSKSSGAYAEGKAAIRCGEGCALAVTGPGRLYLYKHGAGAGIGGNGGEANGALAFALEGSLFAKGSQQGAVIGAGASSGEAAPGTITFESGEFNVVAVARGAAIGGSAGSTGASVGTEVTVMPAASVNVNQDWTGAAVGGGGYSTGNDAAGGNLYMAGGSLRVYVDANVSDGVTGYGGTAVEQGVCFATVSADRWFGEKAQADEESQAGALPRAYPCAVDVSAIPPDASGLELCQDFGHKMPLLS